MKKPRPAKPRSSVVGKLDPARCEAKAKTSGKQCRNKKGFRTDHEGEGKCYMHGGLTPIKTGRYSNIKGRNRFAQLVDRFAEDKDPLDILPELAMARAILTDFVERYGEWAETIFAWHESYTGLFNRELSEIQTLLASKDPEQMSESLNRLAKILATGKPKPNKIMDQLEAVKAIKVVADLVDKVVKARENQQIPLYAVMDMQRKMGMVVAQQVAKKLKAKDAQKVVEDISTAWEQIQIEV